MGPGAKALGRGSSCFRSPGQASSAAWLTGESLARAKHVFLSVEGQPELDMACMYEVRSTVRSSWLVLGS